MWKNEPLANALVYSIDRINGAKGSVWGTRGGWLIKRAMGAYYRCDAELMHEVYGMVDQNTFHLHNRSLEHFSLACYVLLMC